MLIPLESLANLTCTKCNNYLSIFPVHYHEEEQTFICGRCDVGSLTTTRQLAYEALAKHLSFPCQYKTHGCFKFFTPDEMAAHEAICTYKPFHCVYLPENTCSWLGHPKELFEHYQRDHRLLTFKNFKFEVDLINKYVDNYVFEHNDETFVANLQCKPSTHEFICHVSSCESNCANKYSYVVTFFNSKGDSYEVSKRQVNFIKTDHTNTSVVDIRILKHKLQDPLCVLCHIEIVEEVEVHEQIQEFDETMLKNIECPVCMMIMVPPIQQCVTGHSFCSSCLKQVNNCPTCRQPIGHTRNYSLEEFTKHINRPCKYRRYGCHYLDKMGNIEVHEKECKLAPIACPVETCSWNERRQLLKTHVKEQHDDKILRMNTLTFIYTCGHHTMETYMVLFNDQVFSLEIKYDGADFFWRLHLIGPSNEYFRYMLELDICSANKERILIRKACELSIGKDDCEHPCIHLYGYMLKDAMKDEILTYNFRIVLDDN